MRPSPIRRILDLLAPDNRPRSADRLPPIELPDGRSIPVTVRRSTRARRMALKLHPAAEGVELVLPPGVALARALAFLESRKGWVQAQATRLPPRIPFAEGAEIPVLGRGRRLTLVTGGRSLFHITETAIEVRGDALSLARRTRSGLAAEARRHLAGKTKDLSAAIGRPVGRITVGDATSRWGSCASSGNIRFSWRLILAPETVMDYVVAHEVAHLVEMNHSNRFWRLVEELAPGHETPRTWLKRHGATLLRYG